MFHYILKIYLGLLWVRMMNKSKKSSLIIAGAGAGKTTELIRRIKKDVKTLSTCKILAVITYTNAATNEIRERLEREIVIPPNVFIGTIHSFLIQYIIKPYGHVLDLVSSELIITQYDVNIKARNPADYVRISNIQKHLSKKGVLTYDNVTTISKKILENDLVKDRFCNRIEFLFVDEFQDSSKSQFEIFDRLRKGKNTKVTILGDPEQRIMSFQNRNRKSKNSTHPIVSIQNKTIYTVEKIYSNYRSSETIVKFLNNFHTCIVQECSNNKINSKNNIIFISSTDLDEIINDFDDLCFDKNYCQNKPKNRFFLAFENKEFDKYNINPVSKIKDEVNVMDYIMIHISKLYNIRKTQLPDSLGLDIITIREKCLRIFYDIKNSKKIDCCSVLMMIEKEFGLPFNHSDIIKSVNFDRLKMIEDFIKEIKSIRIISKEKESCKNNRLNDKYLTIHKSKGLQADAVLVVARSEKELLKWIETDKEERINAKNDDCRIGYVAFSRAREFLCIACKQEISKETLVKLKKLNLIVY